MELRWVSEMSRSVTPTLCQGVTTEEETGASCHTPVNLVKVSKNVLKSELVCFITNLMIIKDNVQKIITLLLSYAGWL